MPIRSPGRHLRRQQGQALVESILACSVFMVFLFGLQWVWRFGELRQLSSEAARFATWERSAYNTSGDADDQSVYASDADIAPAVFRNIYLTPRGARQAQTEGGGALLKDHADWMKTAARFFTDSFDSATFAAVANSALQISTSADKIPNAGPMGFDPTGDTVTSLKLDRQPYQRVQVSGTLGQSDFISGFMERAFGIVPAAGGQPGGKAGSSALGSLTMVTNSWSAPGAVARNRIVEELNPLAGSNRIGNVLNNKTDFNLTQLIGGPAGFGGNYRVDKSGINPAQVSSLVSQAIGGSWGNFGNPNQWIKAYKPTDDYKENFNLDGGSTEPDFVGVKCSANPDRNVRLTQYTQDELCPADIMRARVILPFDNQAWRFSPAP
jgi:hypothetical protein